MVDDGEVEESNEEIELSEALKIEPDFEIGEESRIGKFAVLTSFRP